MTFENKSREVVITIFQQNYIRGEFRFDFNSSKFTDFICLINKKFAPMGYGIKVIYNNNLAIDIKSYSDLLNSVKISSPESNGNQCVGHCIGKSEHLDILEDIEAALRRVIFAPETIAPANEFRKVCHNCGCGC